MLKRIHQVFGFKSKHTGTSFSLLFLFTLVIWIAGLSSTQLFSKPASGFSGTTGSQA
ncbi:MAG: hypothetical protein ACTSWN_12010 [Promethearchaeota archaeon]